MASSLSNLVDNFAEGIRIVKSKIAQNNKKMQSVRIK